MHCGIRPGVDVARLLELEPVFAEFEHRRASQKAKYFGEFFPARMTERGSGLTFLEFFQTDRHTGETKGIVAIDL